MSDIKIVSVKRIHGEIIHTENGQYERTSATCWSQGPFCTTEECIKLEAAYNKWKQQLKSRVDGKSPEYIQDVMNRYNHGHRGVSIEELDQ